MNAPSVGVVVTTYRVGALLDETIASLLAQTAPPQRVVVVDDASPDHETALALERAERAPTVSVLRQPVNGGVSAARNRGIAALDCDLVALLDGDDLFAPTALAEFTAALLATPEAGFAYPTVATFGNRNDLFPAPTFNLYALHHVNICPIGSMMRRAIPDAGVHFADGINPEDWDFWLRAAAAGYLGVPAPRAVLHWRRWGFTRLTSAIDRVGGLEGGVRRARPELFAPARLDAIKRKWAPGLTILAADPAAADLSRQIGGDAEVVAAADPDTARGRHILIAPAALEQLLGDEFFVDTILTLAASRPHVEAIAVVGADALTHPVPLGTALTDAALRGIGVDVGDVVAVAVDRHVSWDPAIASWGELIAAITERAAETPERVLSVAGPPGVAAAATADHPLRLPAAEDGWMAELLAGLPARTTISGAAEAATLPPSQLVRARVAIDGHGGLTLFDEEDVPPAGITVGAVVWELMRESFVGTVPLLRTIDAGGRRGLAAGHAPGRQVEAVVGYLEATPVPGAVPMFADDGQRLGWAYLARAARLGTVVLGSRRPLWRSVVNGRHLHGWTPEAVELSPEAPPATVCATIERAPADPSAWRPLYGTVMDDRIAAISDRPLAVGDAPIGYLRPVDDPHAGTPVYLRRAEVNGDLLVTTNPGEGEEVGFRTVVVLGRESPRGA